MCCQLGSREHYAIPRALQKTDRLALLLTDYWSNSSRLLKKVPLTGVAKLAERYHPDLAETPVEDLGLSRLKFDLKARMRGWTAWETMIMRNEWFQREMLVRLKHKHLPLLRELPPGFFFAYSYAALHLLEFFRGLGWTTILGQIDPGIREEERVAKEVKNSPDLGGHWTPAPPAYWNKWRKECELSDLILVNSSWSRTALVEKGIGEEKIKILPLAYQGEARTTQWQRRYPAAFTKDRPLRVLFLGQINIRKGIHHLLGAAEALRDAPVEFWMVGPSRVEVPLKYERLPRVKWFGVVSRSQAASFYRKADLFILPTVSDGFALTQLEAQEWGLPIVASRFCGEVVEEGKNGLIVDPLNKETIAAALIRLMQSPQILEKFSENSRIQDRFTLNALQEELSAMEGWSIGVLG